MLYKDTANGPGDTRGRGHYRKKGPRPHLPHAGSLGTTASPPSCTDGSAGMQDPSPTPLSALRGDTPLPGHCANSGSRSAVGNDLASPRGGDTRQGQEAGAWESRGVVGFVQIPLACALGVELAALGSPDSRPGWRLAPGSPGCPGDTGRPPPSCLRQRAWVWAPPARSWAFCPWKLCHLL